MFDWTMHRIRRMVQQRRLWMTVHADDKTDEDDLTVLDVEQCVLTGEIIERQRDQESGEWKYVIQGETIAEQPVVVVAKISPTDVVIIVTVYVL